MIKQIYINFIHLLSIYERMSGKKKRIITIAGGIICLAVLVLVINFVVDLPYRSKLPDVPDLKGSPAPLTEQILDASIKAHRNPSADNIGDCLLYTSPSPRDRQK